MKTLNLLFFLLVWGISAHAQTISITVDVTQNRKPVSPGIYGINNVLSDDPSSPSPKDPAAQYPNDPATTWQRLRDAGIKLFRDNHGNNATKYNWRLKLSSSPDWYNNVYGSDWDFMAKSLQQNIPGAQGLLAFQLIGKAASSDQHNFDDWDYNGSQWWDGVSNNWAGGGGPTSVGGNGGNGDPNLYLENWTADSTVKILDKWFGTGGLGLNKNSFPYWNMDNEPEIWYSTHDDVMPKQLSAEDFMQRYFKVAKAARAKFPAIKLVGFVPCAEWFWYAYDDGTGTNTSGPITSGGKQYSWVEYFIKRIGEEQNATGIRLLDVVDLHTYLDAANEAELLQIHRVFYDKNFDYPGANGSVQVLGSTREYIFARINAWLDQYLGTGHGVTLGSTESGWDNFNQMPQALSYASILGVFANNGVEVFTPWYWSPSYWEVVHLFSRYGKNISVLSTSSDDNNLSAYATTNANNDSLTVVMVNRYSSSKNVNVLPTGINIPDGTYDVLTLNNLPADNTTITFVSHTQNALKKTSVTVSGGAFTLSLPALSITSVILKGASGPYLNVNSNTLNVAAAANSTGTITVSSNAGTWTASSDQAWLTVSPGTGSNNGSITVTATSANTSTTTTRDAHVTVTNGTITKTVTVTQLAQSTLSLNPTSVSIAAPSNSSGTFAVTSNTDWTVSSNQTWLSVDPSTGSGNGTVTVTANSNNLSPSATRSATVTVTVSGLAAQTVTVTQAAATAVTGVTVAPTSLTISGSSQQLTATVSPANATNQNVTWSSSDQSVAAVSSNGLVAGITAGTAVITVKTEDGNKTATANVTVTTPSVTNLITNPGFEASPAGTGWDIGNSFAVSTADKHAGTQSIKVSGCQVNCWTNLYQAVNVTPNTDYILTFWIKGTANVDAIVTDPSWANRLGENDVTPTSNWTIQTITFNSGSNSQILVIFQDATSGTSYIDDVQLFALSGPANPPTLTVSPASLAVASAANSTKIFTITSNAAWTASSSQTWLKVSSTSGTGNTTITVTATSANPSTTATRSATVTVTVTGLTPKTVTVTQDASPAALSATPETISIPATAGTTSITVASNITWSAVSDQTGWLTVSPASASGSGTVVATASANTTTSARTAHVTVSGSGITQTVTITQAAAAANITVSATTVNLNATINSSSTFTVTSNIAWSITGNPTWLTVSPTTGVAGGPTTITVTANSANTATAVRTATLTVSGTGATSRTVTVTQAGAGSSLLASPLTWSPVAAGGSQDVTVTSNISWNVAKDQTWLSISATSGVNNGSVTITAVANTSAVRTGHVTISGTGVTTQTLTITQAAATASLSATPLVWSPVAVGGSQDVTVTSNISWNVAKDQSWLSISATSGANNGSVTITAAANTSAARTGHVTISGTGVATQTVTITQTAAPLTLSVSPETLNVAVSATASFYVTSNTDWSANSDQAWLHLSPSSGGTSGTVTLTADTNKTTSERTATVTVSGTGVASKTVTVKQAASPASSVLNVVYACNIYPNPLTDKVRIKVPDAILELKLYNISGSLLICIKPNVSDMVLDMSAYPLGVYILKVGTQNRTIEKKLVKN
jgi:hypothetical protein